MSTYLNSSTGHEFRIDAVEGPSYLKEFLNFTLVVQNLAPRTVDSYYLQMRSFMRWLKCRHDPTITTSKFREITISDVPFSMFEEITTTDIYEYLSFSSAFLKNGDTTRGIKLTVLKAFYRYFTKDVKRLDSNPVEDIKMPKKEKHMPIYLSVEESKTLLDSVSGDMPERDYCIITFFINCGMRLSELAAINVSDIREDKLRIFGKGRKERMAYLNDACVNALEEYLEVRSTLTKVIDDDALWLSKHTGKRLTARRIEQLIEKDLFAAGLEGRGYSPHKLRHTAASLMYQNDSANLLQIKEILGHESVSTTELYTHVSQKELEDVAKKAPLANLRRKKEI